MVVDVQRRKVLAHPYNKFWNHGETLAAPIAWSSANVFEKLDGSLMIMYWDDRTSEWAVASSGTPCAGGGFGSLDSARTFREAFWQTFDALGMERPGITDACFMFELCATENRIVVRHETPRLVLHGARDVGLGIEWGVDMLRLAAERYNWELVKTYPIATIDGCLVAAEALDPIATEGFVVCDAQFNRVKIKSPRYVILHHMKGEATPRRAIELWQTGETAELLSHFPEMSGAILPVHERLDMIANHACQAFDCARSAKTRKEFAEIAKRSTASSVLFKLYGSETVTPDDVRRVMRGFTLPALERMLDAT